MDICYKRVHVVINPAAGKDAPILNTLNRVFHKYGVDWQISITKMFGDATQMTREAVADGASPMVLWAAIRRWRFCLVALAMRCLLS